MPEQHRQSWKKFFYSNLFLGLVIGSLLFILLNLVRVEYQNKQVDREIARLQMDVKKLEAKKIETLDALKYVESPSFVEEKARLQFNVVRPGESVAIVGSDAVTHFTSSSNDLASPIRTPREKWLRIFFKKN